MFKYPAFIYCFSSLSTTQRALKHKSPSETRRPYSDCRQIQKQTHRLSALSFSSDQIGFVASRYQPSVLTDLRGLRQTQWNRLMNIMMFLAAVMAGFTVQWEVWHHPQSNDCWEHVVLKTFDDERWCANFRVLPRTFVRLCCHQATDIVCQETPFRHPASVKWSKRHSDKRFEQPERPDCRCIFTNRIWITFRTTLQCGLDLIRKNRISCDFFAVQT